MNRHIKLPFLSLRTGFKCVYLHCCTHYNIYAMTGLFNVLYTKRSIDNLYGYLIALPKKSPRYFIAIVRTRSMNDYVRLEWSKKLFFLLLNILRRISDAIKKVKIEIVKLFHHDILLFISLPL